MADALSLVYHAICAQDPLHTWSPGGTALPLCQRCTGFYAGAAIALLMQVTLRFAPGPRFLTVHGLFLLAMIPLGYHWVPQDAVVRAVSGVLFGAGVVSFLWLRPGPRLFDLRDPAGRVLLVYAAVVTGTVLGIQAVAVSGGRLGWYVLAVLGTAGIAGLAVLAAANGLVLVRGTSRRDA